MHLFRHTTRACSLLLVKRDDHEHAQLVQQAKWRILAKLDQVRRSNDLVMVVCAHGDERGRRLATALGLDVDRVGAGEPAVGIAAGWLVEKPVGAPFPPSLTGRSACSS